jgi:hypothetical protein
VVEAVGIGPGDRLDATAPQVLRWPIHRRDAMSWGLSVPACWRVSNGSPRHSH